VTRAARRRPAARTGPPRAPAGYSGTPLVRKLGVQPGAVVAVVGAPEDFGATLGALPEGARLRSGARGACDVVVWFARAPGDVARAMRVMSPRADFGRLWVAWRKQRPGERQTFGEALVRESGLAAGLVDYKICAVDAIWSGLCFSRRRLPPGAGSRPATRRG